MFIAEYAEVLQDLGYDALFRKNSQEKPFDMSLISSRTDILRIQHDDLHLLKGCKLGTGWSRSLLSSLISIQ